MKEILEYFKSEIAPLLRDRKNLIILGVLILALFIGIDMLGSQKIFKSRATGDPIVFGGSNAQQRSNGTWTTTSSQIKFQITSPLGSPPPAQLSLKTSSLKNSLLKLLSGKIVGTVYAQASCVGYDVGSTNGCMPTLPMYCQGNETWQGTGGTCQADYTCGYNYGPVDGNPLNCGAPAQVCEPGSFDKHCSGNCAGCDSNAGEQIVRQCKSDGSGYDPEYGQCSTDCAGPCQSSNYCTDAGYHACTVGNPVGSCVNGQQCFETYKCNFSGQDYCDASNCVPCTSVSPTPTPGACTVSWSYSSSNPSPNTDVTVTVTGGSGGNGWQSVGYKIDGGAFNTNFTSVTGGSAPKFVFKVPSGAAGSNHTISFGTNSGSKMCSPNGQFTTVGATPPPAGNCPSDNNLTISPNPAKIGDTITFQYKAGEDTNIGGDTWSGGINPNPCPLTNLLGRQFTCTAQSAVSNATWNHRWNNQAKCGSATYTITGGAVVLRGKVVNESGQGIGGVVINQNQPDCNIGSATTNSDGTFSFPGVPASKFFCMRAPTITGYNGPDKGYECQTAGTYVNPAGPGVCNQDIDMRTDDAYNFAYHAVSTSIFTTKFRVAENPIDFSDADFSSTNPYGWQNYTTAVASSLYTYSLKDQTPGIKTIFVQFMDSTGRKTTTTDCPKCQAQIELLACTINWTPLSSPPAPNTDVILQGQEGTGDFPSVVFSIDGGAWRSDFNSISADGRSGTIKMNSNAAGSPHSIRVSGNGGSNICTPPMNFTTAGGTPPPTSSPTPTPTPTPTPNPAQIACTIHWLRIPSNPSPNTDVIFEGQGLTGDFSNTVYSRDNEPWRNDFNSVDTTSGLTATVKINSGIAGTIHNLRVATYGGSTVCDSIASFTTGNTPPPPTCTAFSPDGLNYDGTDTGGKPKYSTSDYHGGNRALTLTFSPAGANINQPIFTKTNAGAPDLTFNQIQGSGRWQVIIPDNISTTEDNDYTVSDSITNGDNTVQCTPFDLHVPKKPVDTSCPSDINSTQAMMQSVSNTNWSADLTVILGETVSVAGFYNHITDNPASDVILTVTGPDGSENHVVTLTNQTNNIFSYIPEVIGRYAITATKSGKTGSNCTGSAILTVNTAPVVTTKYRIAESLVDLDEAGVVTPWLNYTPAVASNPLNYPIKDQTPGVKTVFVQFMDSKGKIGGCGNNQNQPCQKQIKILGADPVINTCSLGFEGNNAVLNLTGLNFGNDKGTISSGDAPLQIRSWVNNNVQAVLQNAPTGQVLPVSLVNTDGQTGSGQCSSISMLSLGARVFCRAPASNNTDNVDLVLVDESGKKMKQKVSIDKDGVILGLTQRLEDGKRYALSLKAPRSLRRSVSFTAGGGMVNLPNFILPIGDIFPVDGGDGAINTNDHAELVRQWNVSGNATGRSADFNMDGRVNSIDWACMRYDYGKLDDSELMFPLSSPSPSPTVSSSPSPSPS